MQFNMRDVHAISLIFQLFAIMLIVPGAVMLADVTYVNQKVVPLMKTLSVGSFNAADLADGLAIAMVGAGGVILFIATLGICGACKKARSCLCVVSTSNASTCNTFNN